MLYPNYRLAAEKAVEVLEDYEITQAPIELKFIFEALSREIQLLTYHDYMRESGKTLEEAIADFDSELGVCMFEPSANRFLIYYNSGLSDEWCHFTLAHELGHIFLEHHNRAGTNKLSRSFVPQKIYDIYEKEANVFARHLLSPAPLAYSLYNERPRNIVQTFEIAFNITKLAARVRLDKLKRDIKDYSNSMIRAVQKIEIQCKPMCWGCKHLVPKGAKYCPFCGGSNILHFLWYKPIPDEIPANHAGVFRQCPRCNNNVISEDARYCIICGFPVRNLCLGNSRDGEHINPSYAKYCVVCGNKTIMHKIDWKDEVGTSMKYEDGVPFDSETMRVMECPLCHNEEFGDNAKFCRICGTDLYNYCDGLVFEDDGNGSYVKDRHPNPSNARFCEICGRPTCFGEKGILCNYESYPNNNHGKQQAVIGPTPAHIKDDDIPF